MLWKNTEEVWMTLYIYKYSICIIMRSFKIQVVTASFALIKLHALHHMGLLRVFPHSIYVFLKVYVRTAISY